MSEAAKKKAVKPHCTLFICIPCNALTQNSLTRKDGLLLQAFAFSANAAQRALNENWPDDAWRNWRYRRATLARLLAREGMMQQVADAYRDVLDKPTPR
jgi:hypothetical protein